MQHAKCMPNQKNIQYSERGLLIGGDPVVVRRVLNELRETYEDAGREMSKTLGDVVLSLEASLPTFQIRAYHNESDYQNRSFIILDDSIASEKDAVEIASEILIKDSSYEIVKILSSNNDINRVFKREIEIKEVM